MMLCENCKTSIENVRSAKELLLKLDLKSKSS